MLSLLRRGRGKHERLWGEAASLWLDGELPPEQAARFMAHASVCAICQARLADYRRLQGRLDALEKEAVPPPTYATLERASATRRAPFGPDAPRRLALASAVALVAIGGGSAPPVRQAAGNFVQYVRQIAAPATSTSYAGDRAIFKAPPGSVIASAVPQYGVYLSDGNGAHPRALSAGPAAPGPVFSLRGGRTLFRSQDGGWLVASGDGSEAPFPVPAGMEVESVTPGGDRVLLRTPDGAGGFSTGQGATVVLDDAGKTLWRDPGGADVYSLSPDGRYALSGDPTGLVEIPLAGGSTTTVPFGSHAISRPQLSSDGRRMVFVAEGIGAPGPALHYAVLGQDFGVPSYNQPIPSVEPPVFALAPDGNHLAVEAVNSGGARTLDVWTLQQASGSVDTVPAFTGASITALAWSPDGRRLLVIDDRGGKGEAWIWSASGPLTQLMPDTGVESAAWLADGSGIALVSDGGALSGLVAVKSDSGGDAVTSLLAKGSAASPSAPPQPAFTASGGEVALLSAGAPPELLARRGLAPAALTTAVDRWSWAPDGRRAVVVRNGSAYLWDARTGLAGTALGPATQATWAPAGERILLVDRTGAGSIVDPHGRVIATLPAALAGGDAVWSPDGRRLAAAVQRDGSASLLMWQVGQGGSPEVRTLATGGGIGEPVWSPDGKTIAFFRSDSASGAAGLFLIASTGGDARQIARAAGYEASLRWQADGSRLLFVDQSAPAAAGPVHSVAADGSGDRTIAKLDATTLYSGPR